MTATPPFPAEPDICQFLCVHGSATFTFGMLYSDVFKRSKLLTKQLSGTGQDPAKARKGIEDTLRGNVERGFHERPPHQFEMGMILMWLTTTSEAALEDLNARGFVLEFSDSPLNSRNPLNMTVFFTSPGNPALPGQGRKNGGRFAHYWTEPTAEAVVKLCERFRAQACGAP
jgi:hypothetical protein